MEHLLIVIWLTALIGFGFREMLKRLRAIQMQLDVRGSQADDLVDDDDYDHEL
jgi:hypothetical protein